jgi:2-methyl-3-hydroxypyridine 5-carboxylic acid dioxygenase
MQTRSTSRHAEIAGAGFSGLAAATMLARRGWSVQVHEMADEPRSGGAGIWVHTFAQDVLKRLGAFDAVAAAAFTPMRREIHVDGVHRSTTDTRGLFRTTTRSVLHRAVLDAALAAGVKIATRSRAVAAEPSGALILEDGSRRAADLVIAADGVRSLLARSLGLPMHRTVHKDGITRVLLDRTGMRGPEWDCVADLYDYRFRPLRVLYTPCGPDVFYFCLMSRAGDAEGNAIPVDADLWVRSFPRLAGALRRIGDRGRHDRYTTATLPRWTSGRVAVIGDAAHAMPSALGQGAGVSMMNAVELADAVAGAPDVETGLATWEARLRPVIEQWQREAETVANQRTLDGAVHPGADFDVERTGDFPSLQKSEMAAS